jgi:competence protein ComEC
MGARFRGVVKDGSTKVANPTLVHYFQRSPLMLFRSPIARWCAQSSPTIRGVSSSAVSCWALAWLGGIAAQLVQPALWSQGAYVAMLGCATATVFLSRMRSFLLSTLVAGVLGFAVAGCWGSAAMQQQLASELEGRDIQVVGVVAGLPRELAHGVRFQLDVELARADGRVVKLPKRLALGWYAPRNGSSHQSPIKAGQRWQLQVRLKRPHGLMNPHGFDYELYLLEQGIGASGYVREEGAELLAQAGFGLQRMRQSVRDAIQAQVSDPRLAGVLAGLSVGDQAAIDRDDWALFRATGITHLVSISGLHVTMLAWLAAAVAQWLWRRHPRAALWWPAPLAGRWVGLLVALAYALFAGWGVPAQRTVWMLAVVTLLYSSGRRWPWPLVLLFAAVVVTALSPWALLQPGFWLSFTAVGLLMASGNQHADAPEVSSGGWRVAHRVWTAGLRTQVVATVGLAPLSLVFFQQLSLVGFVANLVAIPVISFLVTPLALLGVLLPPLWTVAAQAVSLLTQFLGFFAAIPGVLWTVAAAPWWAQCAALLGSVVLVLPLPWRVRLLALPLCLPLCWPNTPGPAAGQFELLAVDIGQGTAALVRTQNHLLVFDTGPQYSEDSDAGERVLLPLLQARGDRRIDTLMLSHRDTDHVGGASALLRSLPVGQLSSSLEKLHPLHWQAQAQGIPSERCIAGQTWWWDGVRFDVLHPTPEDYGRVLKPNAMSCVLRIQGAAMRGQNAGSVLLTGDIEQPQEADLIHQHGDALASSVVFAPHHGSKTSSSTLFVHTTAPKVAVVQAGYRNRFGHPRPEVVRRWQDSGASVVQTSDCGAWLWSSDQLLQSELGQCWRQLHRRYWHGY